MARFYVDGAVIDTSLAKSHWEEALEFDGRNQISKATRSQWHHEDLYLSRRGRYYIVSSSNWQGCMDSARFISKEEAATWLLLNGHEVPTELREAADSVIE